MNAAPRPGYLRVQIGLIERHDLLLAEGFPAQAQILRRLIDDDIYADWLRETSVDIDQVIGQILAVAS